MCHRWAAFTVGIYGSLCLKLIPALYSSSAFWWAPTTWVRTRTLVHRVRLWVTPWTWTVSKMLSFPAAKRDCFCISYCPDLSYRSQCSSSQGEGLKDLTLSLYCQATVAYSRYCWKLSNCNHPRNTTAACTAQVLLLVWHNGICRCS